MPDKFKSLSDVILKDAAFSKFRHSVKENNVVVEFEKIFPKLSKTVIASNVNKGILYLIVDNSVLRNEISLNKSLMIERITKYFNQQLIVDVKFTNFRNINRKTK
jgi:Dna[CI] antecedent, DciA